MRAPDDKPERKTAVMRRLRATRRARARAKFAAKIEQYIKDRERISETVLNAKPRRGRPRKERPRRLTWAERRGTWARNWLRRRQGRTPDHERNQSLKYGYLAAKSQGMKMRAFVRTWFREWHGCEPTPEEVKSTERQIDRLLKK
jgi:hypothetical protein